MLVFFRIKATAIFQLTRLTLKKTNLSTKIYRVIDHVRGKDGWILTKLFLCVFMNRDGVEENKHTQKGPTTPISRHLDRTSLVNKGFIIWLLIPGSFAGHSGKSRVGKIALPCPLGQPIAAQDSVHFARSRSKPYNKNFHVSHVGHQG